MALRLYPEAKRALLEQSIRVQTDSDLFIKLLTVNRSFINVGRCYKITQLVIDMSSQISIFFGVDRWTRTKSFNLSVEQTRQLIELFQIKMLKIYGSYTSKGHFQEYWSLIDSVEGKVDLDLSYLRSSEEVELINRFWHKITSLCGPSKLLSSNQLSKHFDNLSVLNVDSFDGLKQILRHEVNELEIEYKGDLSMDEVQKFLETALKTNIKKCELIRSKHSGKINVIVPLVECIVGVSSMCQKIEINIKFGLPYAVYDMEKLVDEIVRNYEIFTQAKNLLLALPFKLELSVFASLEKICYYENIGDNWLDLVKQKKPEFSKGVHEVKISNIWSSENIVIQDVDEALKSTFKVSVYYKSKNDGN